MITAFSTFRDYSENWLKTSDTIKSPNTRAAFDHSLRRNVYPIIGHIPLNRISYQDIEDVMHSMRARGVSPSNVRLTAALTCRILQRAYYDHLLLDNSIYENYHQKYRHYKEVNEFTFYSDEEEKKILPCMMESSLKNYFFLCLLTGMKNGEVAALRKEDINFDTGEVSVRRCFNLDGFSYRYSLTEYKPDDKRYRTIPLSISALECIEDEVRQNPCNFPTNLEHYIFFRKERPLRYGDIRNEMHQIKAASGVKDFNLKGLRNQFGVNSILQEINPVTIKNYCGFTSNKSPVKYWLHASEKNHNYGKDTN